MAKQIKYLSLLLLLVATPSLAYVMSSTNYTMERDSINFAGGLSTSTSYGLEGTAGEVGTGLATSTSYSADLGYQQPDGTTISLSVVSTAALTPNINAAVGGIASTSATFSVITNSSAGYTMQIKASTLPALKGTAFDFDNYTTNAAIPDYSWSVGNTDAEFGFTPEGSDIPDRFRDNGISCNQPSGADVADACWDSLTTTYATVAGSVAPNYPAGADTTVKFRAEAGSLSLAQVGDYSATVIVTAYTN